MPTKRLKSPPLEGQIQDSARLRELFEQRAGMSQLEFGQAHGIGNQGMVWQYLNADRPKGSALNVAAAIKFAEGLHCRVSDFSPSLQREIDRIAAFASDKEMQGANDARTGVPRSMGSDEIEEKFGLERGRLDNPINEALPPVFTAERPEPLPGYVRFDRLDVHAAAGDGTVVDEYPEVVGQIDVLEKWARERFDGSSFGHIHVIAARGTSMSGTIENGDILFVDRSVNHYDSEAIYIIARPYTGVQVKRLQMMGGGRLAILSDNPKNMPEYVEKDEINDVKICGRVLSSWTLKRLWVDAAG